MSVCPECGTGLLSGVCSSCGWHPRGRTLLHANFAADPTCKWCPTPDPDLGQIEPEWNENGSEPGVDIDVRTRASALDGWARFPQSHPRRPVPADTPNTLNPVTVTSGTTRERQDRTGNRVQSFPGSERTS